MMDKKLLDWLRCPVDGQSLEIAEESLIAELNTQIREGRIRDRSDQAVEEPLDQGLVTSDQARIYPVRGGIPTLIVEHAVELPLAPQE